MKFELVELAEGVVETFTQIMVQPASFSANPPYIVAIAKMREGVRVLAWLTGVELSKVQTGMKVRLVPSVDANGPTYSFVP